MTKSILWLAWGFLLLMVSAGYAEVSHQPINKEQLQKLKAKQSQVIAYFNDEGERVYSKSRSYYFRKLLKVNDDGSYVIQDFYSDSDKKQIDPVTLTNINECYAWETMSIDGDFILWYENGQKEQQSFYVKGRIEGKILTWYDTGAKQSESSYISGKAEGRYIEWYESGAKESEAFYVNDLLEGEFKSWYESGALSYRVVYVKGKAQGVDNEWYEDGQLASSGVMLDGKRDGVYKTWYKNGQLKTEVYFREGKKEGKEKKWDKAGQLVMQRNFQQGHVVWPKSQSQSNE